MYICVCLIVYFLAVVVLVDSSFLLLFYSVVCMVEGLCVYMCVRGGGEGSSWCGFFIFILFCLLCLFWFGFSLLLVCVMTDIFSRFLNYLNCMVSYFSGFFVLFLFHICICYCFFWFDLYSLP